MAGLAASAAPGLPAHGEPPLAGDLRTDEKALAEAAQDFGHIVGKRPKAVLHPRSAKDIATAIRWANRSGSRIACRGRGHSVFGRSQADGGIVVAMTGFDAVHAIEDDRITVDAGITWRGVLAAALPRRLTPPVLTEYLDLTVGGTLAVGGIGGATTRHGMQADNVLEIEAITGDGRELRCSPDNNRELFEIALGGLGQFAVITKATLRLTPAPRKVTRFALTYRDLGPFLADQRALAAAGAVDALAGAVLPGPDGWTFRIDAAAFHFEGPAPQGAHLLAGLSGRWTDLQREAVTYWDYVDRFTPFEKKLRAAGAWDQAHPWLTSFIGGSNAERLIEDELSRLRPEDLGQFGQVVLSAFDSEAMARPLVRLPAGPIVFAFNLIRMPQTQDRDETNRQVEANRAIYERVRAAGGSLYPVSAFAMSRDDWRTHFGDVWERMQAAKDRVDPNRVLTPGYDIFT